MNPDSNTEKIKEKWELPTLEVIDINMTRNGESDILDEDTFIGWLVGSGSS